MWKSWRDMIKYWHCLNSDVQEQLDTLATLLPYPNVESRYSALTDWLEAGEAQGLLTHSEHRKLRSYIGPEM